MIILGHDFETTGVDANSCGVVQSAMVPVEMLPNGDGQMLEHPTVSLWNPGMEIPEAASNVHGITDLEVIGMPAYAEGIKAQYDEIQARHNVVAFFGYNNKTYDDKICRRLGIRVPLSLDPIKLVRKMKKDGLVPNAKLVTAYQYFTGKPALNAHDAMADVAMTFEIIPGLMQYAECHTFEEFFNLLTTPVVNKSAKLSFGKNKGVKISAVDDGYLRWMIKKGDEFDQDLVASAQAVLDDRKQKGITI